MQEIEAVRPPRKAAFMGHGAPSQPRQHQLNSPRPQRCPSAFLGTRYSASVRGERLLAYLLISCTELEIQPKAQPEAQRVRFCGVRIAHLESSRGGELGIPGDVSVVNVVISVCCGLTYHLPGLPALLCEPPRVLTPPRGLGGVRADGCPPAWLQDKRCPAALSSVPPGDAASRSAGGPVVGGAGRCLWSR